MARIPQTVIDDIRERSNIVDIVGQYVQLKKSGKIILVCVRSIMKNHLLFPLQRTNKFFIALVVVVVEMCMVSYRSLKGSVFQKQSSK